MASEICREEGEEKLSHLVALLMRSGRNGDIPKIIDKEWREKMYREYDITDVCVKKGKLYYRGYTVEINYDPQGGIYVGIVDGVPDALGFHADTLEELPLHFRNCIDDYIEIVTKYR